jgi:hypothetical protein
MVRDAEFVRDFVKTVDPVSSLAIQPIRAHVRPPPTHPPAPAKPPNPPMVDGKAPRKTVPAAQPRKGKVKIDDEIAAFGMQFKGHLVFRSNL